MMDPENMNFMDYLDLMARGMEIEEQFGGPLSSEELEALTKESDEIDQQIHDYRKALDLPS